LPSACRNDPELAIDSEREIGRLSDGMIDKGGCRGQAGGPTTTADPAFGRPAQPGLFQLCCVCD
jgi:hypothetical protein